MILLSGCAMRLSRVQAQQKGPREDRGVPGGQLLRNGLSECGRTLWCTKSRIL